jgi:hypothetical protein
MTHSMVRVRSPSTLSDVKVQGHPVFLLAQHGSKHAERNRTKRPEGAEG